MSTHALSLNETDDAVESLALEADAATQYDQDALADVLDGVDSCLQAPECCIIS